MWFFPTLIGSFFSLSTYQRVRQTQGYGLTYTFLLVLLSSFLVIVASIVILHQEIFGARENSPSTFESLVKQVSQQLPNMALQQNQLQTQKPGPHTIYLEATIFGHPMAGPVAVIDTTGATTYSNMTTPILITRDDVIMRGSRETKIRSFKELSASKDLNGDEHALSPIVINQAVTEDLGKRFITIVKNNLFEFYTLIAAPIWFILALVVYVLRLAMVFFLGAVGLIISRSLNMRDSYVTCVRMAGVSYTPVALFSAAALVSGVHLIATVWLILCGLLMLSAALIATRETSLAEPV